MLDTEVRKQMVGGLDALQSEIGKQLVDMLLKNLILYGTEFQVTIVFSSDFPKPDTLMFHQSFRPILSPQE